MAIKLEVNPSNVWGFYPNKSVSRDFMKYLDENGWASVPRVPIFKVPELNELTEFRVVEFEREHEYFLLDGNQRLNAAILRRELLPVMLYEPLENIDQIKDGLAPSRNLTNPRRFEIPVYRYSKRKLPKGER
jgi:hypothetical protein